jgi:ribonuclease HII
MPPTKRFPHFACSNRFEREIHSQGYLRLAGIDEVGRGALCGPVVAAAVILDPSRVPDGIDDSKKLTAGKRELLFQEIMKMAWAVGIGEADPKIIDQQNVLKATQRAMASAVGQLHPPADFLLIDAVRLPFLSFPQKSIIKGDAQSVSIAAASIIAKVTRDHMMAEYDRLYPQYLLGQNKGYGTPEHLDSLRRYGPSPIHRRSFRPVFQLDFPFIGAAD